MRMTRGVNGRPSIDPSLSGQRIRYPVSRMLFLFTYSSCSVPTSRYSSWQTSLSIIRSGQIANLNTSSANRTHFDIRICNPMLFWSDLVLYYFAIGSCQNQSLVNLRISCGFPYGGFLPVKNFCIRFGLPRPTGLLLCMTWVTGGLNQSLSSNFQSYVSSFYGPVFKARKTSPVNWIGVPRLQIALIETLIDFIKWKSCSKINVKLSLSGE